MQHIREILLTEYIGAMLVALLAVQAIIVFISMLARQITWYLSHATNEGVFGGGHANIYTPLAWNDVIRSLVSIALYLLTAYLLAHWLYFPPHEERGKVADEQAKG